MTEQFPDDKGLLWAYRLDGNGGGEQQGRLAESSASTPGFDWFHLLCNEPDALTWMAEANLHPDVIEAMSVTDTRPRTMPLAGGHLVYLRGVNVNPGADPEDMIALRIWFNETTIVTARYRDRKLLSIEDVRATIHAQTGPRNTGEFVVRIIGCMANRIGDVVDDIDEVLTQAEISLDADDIHEVQKQLFITRKQSAAIRRYLAPQKEALVELCRSRGIFGDHEIQDLIHQSDRVTLYIEDLDLARERALVMQSDLQNRLAEIQNDRIYLLSIVAAIFLPLSFITGIFGMNVGGLPGGQDPNYFMYLSLGMVAIVFVLMILMRWKKWL